MLESFSEVNLPLAKALSRSAMVAVSRLSVSACSVTAEESERATMTALSRTVDFMIPQGLALSSRWRHRYGWLLGNADALRRIAPTFAVRTSITSDRVYSPCRSCQPPRPLDSTASVAAGRFGQFVAETSD